MTINPKNGYVMTGPSISPENWFKLNGEDMVASMMPTCDIVLVKEIFTSCIEAAKILEVDKKFSDSLKTALLQLPPIKIGKNGGIQEWFEDYEESHPNHRHTSHLLGLYPFSQITLEKTPKLAKAAERTLQLRLSAEGWEDTEWSRANMICSYARLKRPVEAYKSTHMLLKEFTRENLLSISPKGIAMAPYDIFIFDGNIAGAAGIAEMLLQAHEGYIDFLPALPKEWNTGHLKGFCVQGGGEVDLSWENGIVNFAKLKANCKSNFSIKLPTNYSKMIFYKNGNTITIKPDKRNIIQINLEKNDLLEMKFYYSI